MSRLPSRLVWALLLSRAALAEEPTARAEALVERAYERIGRSAPVVDPALSAAAESLARLALGTRAARAGDALAISSAVSAAGGFDPSPRALVLKASPPDEVLAALAARGDLASEPANALGLGWASDDEHAALTILLADRKVRLGAFPHALAGAPARKELCGALTAPLGHPEVYVTRPSGSVQRIAAPGRSGEFCLPVAFPEQGRYTVEVIGTGPRGPEVAALFFTDVGGAGAALETSAQPEPASADEARSDILARINHLRAASSAPPLTLDAELTRVAQGYSERMAAEHFFAHVAPDGDSLTDRLRRDGYAYRNAGENLGLASGPLAAHFGIEHSPGHRKNLLEPSVSRLGVGVATEHLADRDQVLVTEIVANPAAPAGRPLEDAYAALFHARAAAHLPPLRRNAALEELANEQARARLALGEPRAELAGQPLHERVFSLVSDARHTSTDVYITQDVGQLPESKNLLDGSNRQVGIGAVRGDSPRYGKGRYWVVIIYTGG